MNFPFCGVKDFFGWATTAVVILALCAVVVVAGVAFYLIVPVPYNEGNEYGYRD